MANQYQPYVNSCISTPRGSAPYMDGYMTPRGPTHCTTTPYGPTACGPTPCGPTPCGPTPCGPTPCGPTACGPTACGPAYCGTDQCVPSLTTVSSQVDYEPSHSIINMVVPHHQVTHEQHWTPNHTPANQPYRESRFNFLRRNKRFYYRDPNGHKFSYDRTPQGLYYNYNNTPF